MKGPRSLPRDALVRAQRAAPLLLVAACLSILLIAADDVPDRAHEAAAQGETKVFLDLQYYSGTGASTVHHRLDLYLPDGVGQFPVVLFVHGGTWSSGDKNEIPGSLYANIGRALASRGIGVALVNYRLTDGSPHSVVHPGHVRDLARAFSFVRAYLVTGGYDPDNIYLMGHEAGAHLAALLVVNERFLGEHGLTFSNVRGVVGLSGIYRLEPNGTRYSEVFGLDPNNRLDASPAHNVVDLSPRFELLFGELDRPEAATQSRSFAAAISAAGGTGSVYQVPDRTHNTIVSAIGEAGDETTERIISFVFENRQLTPTPTETGTATARPTHTPTPTSTATPAPVAPPAQPPDGPGGAAQPYASIRHLPASEGRPYDAYLPADPIPSEAPVVVFIGRPSEIGLEEYRTWIEHTVYGGAAVVALAGYAPGADGSWTGSAAKSVASALGDLAAISSTRVRVDQLAYVGHEEGAVVAVDLAASWFERHLPAPKAVMVISPRRAREILVGELRRVPNDTMVLFVALEDDTTYDNGSEIVLWDGLRHVPGVWRQRLLLRSDRHGTPLLIADRTTPLTDGASGRVDALDWYGTWKWLDALASCAFEGKLCEYAFGDTAEQRYLGHWADGRPVREALVTDGPERPSTRSIYLPNIHG